MTRPRGDRGEYVVELTVYGVAVVHVEASSDAEACRLAIERVRPVDVTELDAVTVRRGVVIDGAGARAIAGEAAGDAQTAATGSA